MIFLVYATGRLKDFGCAAPSVPYVIGSKVVLLMDVLSALYRLHLFTDFVQIKDEGLP